MAVVTVAGPHLWSSDASAAPPSSDTTKDALSITSPVRKDAGLPITVPRCVTVGGEVSASSSGGQVLGFVKPLSSDTYYLEGHASVEAGNGSAPRKWSYGPFPVGGRTESGTKFTIVAVVVSPATATFLEGLMNAQTLKPAGSIATSHLPDYSGIATIDVQRFNDPASADC